MHERRTQELGIRVALGTQAPHIRSLVLAVHRHRRPTGNETVPHLGAGEPSGPGRTSLFLSDGWESVEPHNDVLFC